MSTEEVDQIVEDGLTDLDILVADYTSEIKAYLALVGRPLGDLANDRDFRDFEQQLFNSILKRSARCKTYVAHWDKIQAWYRDLGIDARGWD